jgi:hypothetical protein
MLALPSHASQVLLPAWLIFVLVWSIAGLAIGLGLLLARGAALRYASGVNRWVSTRQSLRWLELPVDMNRPLWAWRRIFAFAIVAGAAFSLAFLAGLETDRLVQMLTKEPARSSLVTTWAVDSLKWILIVGNLFSLATGIVLALFPRAMRGLEKTFDHWHSTRDFADGLDRQLYPLDRAVAAWPRTAGLLITAASLVSIYTTGAILTR